MKKIAAEKSAPGSELMDSELVSRSLAGDRESFTQIVVRYQTLICSLAYNGLGNLGQSEDVAQETFITAWKQLGQLREPAKLRAWLCGIVRNLVHKNRDREAREPARNAETLEAAADSPASQSLPSEDAISREEQAILWRSLQNIPPLYREPLILFYREHQSIEAVAEELGLSEDAVKQRLSRGRGLLRQEVEAFVEKTLRRTAPGPEFAGLVVGALPGTPATVAVIGTAGKGAGAVAVKSGLLLAGLVPLLGILGSMLAHWLVVRAAPTEQERRLKRIGFFGLWIFVLGWCFPGQLAVRALSERLQWTTRTYFLVMAGFWFFYGIVVATFSVLIFRFISAIRLANERTTQMAPSIGKPLKAGKRMAFLAGVHLACFWWLLALAVQAKDPAGAVLVTIFMAGLAIRNFVRLPGRTGMDAARQIAGHLALVWGIILLLLNWRLTLWEAALHGISPAEMHRLLPMWIIPALSLALVGWVWMLLRLTKTPSTQAIDLKCEGYLRP